MHYIFNHPGTNDMVRTAYASFARAMLLVSMLHVDTYHDSPSKLLSLLDNARRSEATDPRDHVYGIMGLLRGDMSIIPDYRLSILQTFTRTIMLHMERSRTLDVLSYVSHHVPRPKRFTVPSELGPGLAIPICFLLFRAVRAGASWLSLQCLFKQGVSLPVLFHRRALTICWSSWFFLVDTIEETGRASNNDTIVSSVQEWRESIKDSIDALYFGLHSTLEAFWRTIFGDVMLDRRSTGRLGSHIGTNIARLPPSEMEGKLLYSYLRLPGTGALCTRKRFLRIRTGRMGLGSVGIKPGDIVVVLLGGSVPLCLGKHIGGLITSLAIGNITTQVSVFSRRFSLTLRCSYVHGIVDGGIAEEWKAQKGESEIFTLV